MFYPPIAIVGTSGSGKSSSLRNLPPKETLVFNIERKILPFKNSFGENNLMFGDDSSKGVIGIENMKRKIEDLKLGKLSPDITYAVIESFTKYSDEELKRARLTLKGWDIWTSYSEKVAKFIDLFKSIENVWVIVLARPELVKIPQVNGSETVKYRIGVHGKELEKREIESEFTLVLFTEVKQLDKNVPPTYHFVTNNDGTHSAKTPAGMFDATKERLVDNDVMLVIKRAKEFWGFGDVKPGGIDIKV